MPTYPYICQHPDCVGEFEDFHSITIKLETCPHCKEAGREDQPVKRLIAGGSGRGVVELTGQDLTAQIKADTEKMKQRAKVDQNYLANLVGESKFSKYNPKG